MLRRVFMAGGILALSSATLLADFSYQTKSKITGGMMAGAMKVAGVFSKAAREPMDATVAVKGDRMVHRSSTHISITDLSAKTITTIDLQKKTYSVMTFDEMKQALAQMQAKMNSKDNQADVKFNVSAKNTGNTRTINSYDAKETVITMQMEGTDKQSGQSGAMVITADVWTAPAVKGYDEIRDFYKKMAKELDWTPGGGMFGARPDVSKGMAEAAKEVSAMEGMPVFEIVSMGAAGEPAQGGQSQQNAQQSDRPSLGGMLGRLGKKKQQQPDQSSQASAPPTSSGAPNSLMEMTVEMSNFSPAPVDDSQFAIPAGFKKVEPDMKRAGMQ